MKYRFEDAAEFIKGYKDTFDVVVVDSSDPVGPADSLFTPDFYSNLRDSLSERGVICCQGECMWLHLDLITRVVAATTKVFPTVEYAYTSIPSYPSGELKPHQPPPDMTHDTPQVRSGSWSAAGAGWR